MGRGCFTVRQRSAFAGISDQLLGTAPLGKLIVKLAVPAVAGQFINMLYNVIDRVYIGNIPEVGAAALTGVGVTFPILMLISAFSAFTGQGAAPLAGIRLGAGDREGAQRILGNSFCLLVVLSILLTAGFQWFKIPLLYAFGASEHLIGYATDYITIYLWGTASVQLVLGLNPFISVQGKSATAMLSVALGAGLNLILDPIFIFTFNMGVKGAAIATVLSQTAGAVWVAAYLFSPQSGIRLEPAFLKLQPKVLANIAALGVSPFVMQSTESLVTITLNNGMQRYGGDLYVGTITILQSFMQMVMLPLRGITHGSQPIISYNFGAKNYARVRETFKKLLAISLIYTFAAFLTIILFARPLTRVFTSDPRLIDLTVQATAIFFGAIWTMGAQSTCQTTFMGLGQAKISLVLALLRKIILMIPLALALPVLFGSDPAAIYFAEPVSDFLASTTTITLFFCCYKKLLPLGAPQKNKKETQHAAKNSAP